MLSVQSQKSLHTYVIILSLYIILEVCKLPRPRIRHTTAEDGGSCLQLTWLALFRLTWLTALRRVVGTGQSRVKTGLFWRNLTAGGVQTSTTSVEMTARALDFGPILREIRLQERVWARGKFEISETNPKSGEDLAE